MKTRTGNKNSASGPERRWSSARRARSAAFPAAALYGPAALASGPCHSAGGPTRTRILIEECWPASRRQIPNPILKHFKSLADVFAAYGLTSSKQRSQPSQRFLRRHLDSHRSPLNCGTARVILKSYCYKIPWQHVLVRWRVLLVKRVP